MGRSKAARIETPVNQNRSYRICLITHLVRVAGSTGIVFEWSVADAHPSQFASFDLSRINKIFEVHTLWRT